MHGRVLALHGLVFLGSTPLGGPLLGWICETFGARSGFLVAGGATLLAGLALMPRLRRLRRRTVTPGGPESGGPDGPAPAGGDETGPAAPTLEGQAPPEDARRTGG
jgi:MFS family permease